MTPDRGGGGELERRQSGSLSRLFRALTRRGSAEAVPKKLTFSPSKDDESTGSEGGTRGSKVSRKLEQTFKAEDTQKQSGPEASASTQSTEPEFVDSKEEQKEPEVDYVPADQGVNEKTVEDMTQGQEHSAAPTASQGAAEGIPMPAAPAETGLQSETSLERVKPQKVTKGREVKSRFLNTLFTSKPKSREGSAPPRRQSSSNPKREPSLGPQDKKPVQDPPKTSKVTRAANMVRSLSSSRQRPASRGVSSEGAKELVEPVVSRRKELERGTTATGQVVGNGKVTGRRSSGTEHAQAGENARTSNKPEGEKKEPVLPLRKPHVADPDTKRRNGSSVNLNERLPAKIGVTESASIREPVAVSGPGLPDASGHPEAAVLEAVRDRLSLMQVGELADEASALDETESKVEEAPEVAGLDPTGDEAPGAAVVEIMDEELRRERTESGRGASTRGATSDASRNRRAGLQLSRENSGTMIGSLEAECESPGVLKARKHAEWLAKLREQNGKKDGVNVGPARGQPVRKPSEWLVALREQKGQEIIHTEDSTASVGSDGVRERNGQEIILAENSTASVVSEGDGQENGHLEVEGQDGGRSTPGKKARGVVVPSRVWLDNSKKKEPPTDGGGLHEQQGKQPTHKRVSNGTATQAKQRAAFGSLKEAGHWLPSSPRKTLKSSRSAVGSAASTPTESRAVTPSRPETVSAPASPNRTSVASRRTSVKGTGSAPASPKKPGNPGQPRAGSKTKVRPLGGQQSGQDEGGGRVGTSPSKGLKKPSGSDAARHVRVLHNRWLQWSFVNARAQAALEAQQRKAEASIFAAWQATAALRTSVAAQKVQLHRETHGEALDDLLAGQTPPLERWTALEREHRSALGETMAALEAAMLRVPLTGGASADPQRLRSAIADVKQVISTAEPTVQEVLPKAVKTDALLSQLAETAAQERALVKECQDLLAKAATLEIEERSLRAHLIQLGRERESGRSVPVMATPMRQGLPSEPL